MSTEKLLSILCNVKRTGAAQWIASCPAHEDRHPSLSIRELEDGRVLLHDFGGCKTTDILLAAGITFEDLFPERQPNHNQMRVRKPFHPIDVLRCVAFEALLASVAASRLGQGELLSQVDRKRLLLAASRLQRAVEVCNE